MSKKGYEPVVRFNNDCPEWITGNGKVAYGVQLFREIGIQQFNGSFFTPAVSVSKTFVKHKKTVASTRIKHYPLHLFNNSSIEEIGETLKVNIKFYSKFKNMVKLIHSFECKESNETVLFHVTEYSFTHKKWKNLGIIYNMKVS